MNMPSGLKVFLMGAAALLVSACSERAPSPAVASTNAALPRELPVPALRDEPGAGGAGSPRGLYILGARYADGIGVARDPARAADLWRRAAELGDADAQTSLGWLYTLGEGVPRDPLKAADWYRRAAVQGHAAGQLYLGVKLRDGEGLARDPVLAYAWLSLAAGGTGPASTIRLAIRLRDSLAHELSAAQLSEAERLATAWRQGDFLAR